MTGDAPDVMAEELLREWFAQWEDRPDMPSKMGDALHVRTALYLEQGAATVEAAHARDLAALRERAEVAEAKVAAVEALPERWRRRWGDRHPAFTGLDYVVAELHAALADRPAGGEGRG